MTRYQVYITPSAWAEVKALPGHMRQRVRQVVATLGKEPRPSEGKMLVLPDMAVEVWRLRIDRWRIIYLITEVDAVVDVLAIRKRPPYDYGDLSTLLAGLDTEE